MNKINTFGVRPPSNDRHCTFTLRGQTRSSRRGVLLLVVLSMLVLFMLIGTAFLMSSGQEQKAAKQLAKADRVGSPATKRLESALLQVVRDTDNVYSVVRYHSLLRDIYGTGGFQGVVYSPDPAVAFDPNPAAYAKHVSRYAGATAGTAQAQLGPTNGQFIDIYVAQYAYPNIDYSVQYDGIQYPVDFRNVLKLDRNAFGQPQVYPLPLTKDYFNGCVLTITSGPAAGQSTRILGYEYLGDLAASSGTNPVITATRLFRFRVMSFQRADGQPLQVSADAARAPELTDLGGEVDFANKARRTQPATFIVNGRAFTGTGAGYNPLAVQGQPRLNALELFYPTATDAVGAELALLPNSVYFNPLNAIVSLQLAPGADPFTMKPIAASSIPPNAKLNDPLAKVPYFRYTTFAGPGDVNESYDAADFQNMFLALQTVTPRAQGRVWHSGFPTPFSVSDPEVWDGSKFVNTDKFQRLDLEDLPLPSFHRPDLINFWYHRMLNSQWLSTAIGDADQRAVAILQPYDANGNLNPAAGGLTPQLAAMITAIKRQSSLRPLREDHPHFDGGNTQSIRPGLQATGLVDQSKTNIAIPYWEAVGPWDVDNDNDGIPDSVWVDLGDPVQEAEDGTRYKALYAFLIVDLDSRLNVNAHGLADDINPPTLAVSYDLSGNRQTGLAAKNLAGQVSSSILSKGLGYGPAEISLRPVFPAPLDGAFKPILTGNRSEGPGPFNPIDDYAAILDGRVKLDLASVTGKYGYREVTTAAQQVTAGSNYDYNAVGWANASSPSGDNAQPSVAAQIKFFDYPYGVLQASSFGTPPDLFSRYSLGVDYNGQPIYEVMNDINPNTPSTTFPNHALLAKSPYELDLSSSQRRDSWGANFANPTAAWNATIGPNGAPGLNDDAPFSPSDLEKVLRGWDADVGTLPSRLWDCANAFDPLKLLNAQYGDPNRVLNLTSTAFGVASPKLTDPEAITTAQQIAAINRRLVTTESFDLPVAGGPLPEWVRASAGSYLAGLTANPVTAAKPLPVGSTAEDVFRLLTGVEFSKAKIVDLLTYRVQSQRLAKFGMYSTSNTGGAYNTQVAAEQALLGQLIGPLAFQELPPEVVAGKKMDLNRPFGDGKDNNDNGVVDDPLEAGEPFLDINGNGKWDSGEPWIDLDGNKLYRPPTDTLWQGLTSESISFDYTNGIEGSVHKDVVTKLGVPVPGGVRNLESQGRQQYARQLYCLQLLLTDENFIAPWDEADPQIMSWMANEKKKLTDPPLSMPAAQADLIVKRKNTCRTIAQWAINCADMRDADVIMTPFEYDENPWDGWGCTDRDGNLIPIDGDPSTDENGDVTKNQTAVLDWKVIGTNGGVRATMDVHAPASAVDQTRGVVWGAERPELLITETLGLHDRRTEDLLGPVAGDHDEMDGTATDRYKDVDMDQRLRPRGSLFVELKNPWSSEGQYPAELYTKLDQLTSYKPSSVPQQQGVELGRMSNYADDNGLLSLKASDAAAGIKRSPVWRMVVVEDWPTERNRDPVDDNRPDVKPKVDKAPAAAYKGMHDAMQQWKPTDLTSPPYHAPDPDFAEAFNQAFVPKQLSGNKFSVEYPYIEREFYFTTDRSPQTPAGPSKPADWNYNIKSFKLRIPNRAIQVGGVGSTVFEQTQRFISPILEKPGQTQPVIAPIMPGRYGVIGSAGTKYTSLPNCFTTTIGREDTGEKNTKDSLHLQALKKTRRIELVPDADPNKPQVVVASNGGDPKDEVHPGTTPIFDPTTVAIGRDNELIDDKSTGKVENITDLDNDGLPDATAGFYPPSIAIPIDGMNISEPPWGWAPREEEAAEEEDALNGNRPKPSYKFDPTAANGEGAYIGTPGSSNAYSYDKPFDKAGELVRTGTTPNYRTIHLQRLANPLVPWNPPAGQFKDATGKDMHSANLPINPYLTVDSASVNLTAFNGPSEEEHRIKPARAYVDLQKSRPWMDGSTEIQAYLDHVEAGTQAWYFRSSERGAWARLNIAGQAANPVFSPPQRVLWQQEPAMIDFRMNPNAAGAVTILDLMPGRNMTMRAVEIPPQVLTDLNTTKTNHVNMVLEHSLGYGNESFGLLYDAKGSQGPSSTPPTASAIGAPAPGNFTWDKDGLDNKADISIPVNSTNPWLQWGNRPFVSADEVLNVPAASQSMMLRMYSTIDPAALIQPNPYGLATPQANIPNFGSKQVPVSNKLRWLAMHAPFGHMADIFGATAYQIVPNEYVQGVADVVRDPAGVPVLDTAGNVQPYGGPAFYRALDYIEVPSRYVGTDTILNAETFNDVLGIADGTGGTFGTDIANPADPRYLFQPPFNKVSRERDPGKVNLNTVTGRRTPPTSTSAAQIWSEVYDGIMHRLHDANPSATELGQPGPAWRDLVLSRRGYVQFNAGTTTAVDKAGTAPPDVFQFGLNPLFPSVFSNPFRSSDAGDLVPLPQLMQFGVDASMMRKHPYDRAKDANGVLQQWGPSPMNFGDARDAGFGVNERISARTNTWNLGAIPNSDVANRDSLPLFSEARGNSFSDTNRNPYMMYQPMTRLGNLVTERSGCYAIWITVGYFEVEPAPSWNDSDPAVKTAVRARFGATLNDADPATIAGLALYNRVYPEGYMLGREVGSDTGDVKRPRGFYIIDRTEPAGFKPGEDLNVDKLIRVRRRIE